MKRLKFTFKRSGVLSAILFLLLFYLFNFTLFAQESNTKIQLLDESSMELISYAHWVYGEQSGISDIQGFVFINLEKDHDLQVSHVLYGQQNISNEELKKSLVTGNLNLIKALVALPPATVVALRSGDDSNKDLSVSYQDKLSHDAGAFLNQFPSVASIRKSGSYGFDPVLRGFKYEQVNLVIDGAQCAIAACPNRMDPPASQIALNMVESVELLKGPHALRYGNSFAGTFNFKTQAPIYTEKITPVGRLSGSYESNGGIYRTETAIGIREKRINLNLYGSYSQGDDYKDGGSNAVLSEFHRAAYGADLSVKLTDNQDLTYSINNNIANDVDFPALAMDLRSDNTWLTSIKHSIKTYRKVWQSQSNMLYGTFVDHSMDNLSKDLDPRMVDAVTIANTRSYGGKTESHLLFDGSWMYAGFDYKVEEADGYRNRTFLMGDNAGNTVIDNVWQDAIISKAGLFAEYHFNVDKNAFILSGRLERNDARIRNNADEFLLHYDNTESLDYNPGISFGVTHSFENNTKLGFWLGRVQRSGGIAERYINYLPIGIDPYEMLGNPELEPEKNNQADVTVSWSPQKTRIELSVFASYIQDYISSVIREDLSPRLSSSAGVRQFVNLDKALHSGAELSWKQELPVHLNSNLTIAYVYAENLVSNSPLPEIPPLDMRFTLSGEYFKDRLKPELLFRYVLEQNRIAEGYGETSTPSFNLLDFKIAYVFTKNHHLALGVQNLFDRAYYEHLNRSVRNTDQVPIYAPGRNIYLSFTLNFM